MGEADKFWLSEKKSKQTVSALNDKKRRLPKITSSSDSTENSRATTMTTRESSLSRFKSD